jgi:hypothetical protein
MLYWIFFRLFYTLVLVLMEYIIKIRASEKRIAKLLTYYKSLRLMALYLVPNSSPE